MGSVSSVVWGLSFKNAFLEKKGAAFEEWFVKLAGCAWQSDFETARAYGSEGDWKCDGRRVSKGKIFQCYAPESMNAQKMMAKITSDLEGAVEKWPNFIKGWVLVHNDTRGLPPQVLAHIDSMRQRYPKVKIKTWAEPNLRKLFEQLTDQDKQEIFGQVPTMDTMQSITFRELEPVIADLQNREPDPRDDVPQPPSELKLDKNDLSLEAREFLQIGRFKAQLVETYFNKSLTH